MGFLNLVKNGQNPSGALEGSTYIITWTCLSKVDLGVGPGGPALPFVREFFFPFVNVYRILLRALLLKYTFFNKHC